MANEVNPLLAIIEEEEAALAAASANPDAVAGDALDPDGGGPATEGEGAPAPEDVQPRKLTYAEIAQMAEQDPEVRNYLNSLVGRKARKEWKPKVDELEARVAAYELERHNQARQNMDPAAVKDRLLNDPEFARQFHAPAPQPEVIQMRAQIERAVDTVFDSVADVLPDEVSDKYRAALQGGHYDIARDADENPVLDSQGQPIRLSTLDALAQFQSAIGRQARWFAVNAARTRAPEPVASAPVQAAAVVSETPRAKPNPRLSEATPDLSAGGGSSRGAARMKLSEYNALNPLQQIKLYPTTSDLQRALDNGELYPDG